MGSFPQETGRRRLLRKKGYTRELWIYIVLIVLAYLLSSIWGSIWWWVTDVHPTVYVVLSFFAFCIFIYATVRFGAFLEFQPPQWLAAILLLFLCGIASVIYMLTRQPPEFT